MLRGNIDEVAAGQISGWVYSDVSSVTGKKLLVFSGDRCVGAGEIGILRSDLAQAGLGDGRLGFSISFDPTGIKDFNSLHVRLEYSDFALFTPKFHQKTNVTSDKVQELYSDAELVRVEWMNRQGWLTNEQYLGLKALNSLGIYQRTFSKAELAQEPISSRVLTLFGELVSTVYRTDISGALIEVESASTYIPGSASSAKYLDIIGFFGDAFELGVLEGAHHGESSEGVSPIQLRNATHQVTLLHTKCLEKLKMAPKASVQMIRARR